MTFRLLLFCQKIIDMYAEAATRQTYLKESPELTRRVPVVYEQVTAGLQEVVPPVGGRAELGAARSAS